MQQPIHQNYINASNLVFISAGLGIINVFLIPEVFSSSFTIIVGITTLLFIAGLGLLIRQGYGWIKYLLLVLMIVGLLSIPSVINTLSETPIVGIINIIQTFLQLYALFLLFTIKDKNS